MVTHTGTQVDDDLLGKCGAPTIGEHINGPPLWSLLISKVE